MKAISVLLVLVLSTPAYAYCDTHKRVSETLVNRGYVFSKTISKNTAIFYDFHFQQWVIVEVTKKQACIIEGGMYL